MKRESTIFDYLAQVMIIWSVSVLALCLFCTLFGEVAKGYSSMFELGGKGISIVTLMQFLLLAIITTSLKFLFFTDRFIKHWSIFFRTSVMVVLIIIIIGIFAAIFGWFPVNQLKPWILFFLCFFICAFISIIVSVIKEKMDNKKIQEALERLKGEDS